MEFPQPIFTHQIEYSIEIAGNEDKSNICKVQDLVRYAVRKSVDCYPGQARKIPSVPRLLSVIHHLGVCLFYCPIMIDTNSQCCRFGCKPLHSFPLVVFPILFIFLLLMKKF